MDTKYRYVVVWKHCAPTISSTAFYTFEGCAKRAMETKPNAARIYVYEYKAECFLNETLIWDGQDA